MNAQPKVSLSFFRVFSSGCKAAVAILDICLNWFIPFLILTILSNPAIVRWSLEYIKAAAFAKSEKSLNLEPCKGYFFLRME